MPHFAVASTRDFDAAVRRAGNAALGLWTRAGAWSTARLTDGLIPREVAEDLGTAPQIRRLISSGLWSETPDGYVFTTWEEDGNRTRSEVENLSEARRKAGHFGGKASGKSRRSEEKPPERTPNSAPDTGPDLRKPEARASSKTNPLPYPPLPSPTPPPPVVPARAREAAAEVSAAAQAWAEASGVQPSRRDRAAVQQEIADLIEAGNPPAAVTEAARRTGESGYGAGGIPVALRQLRAETRAPARRGMSKIEERIARTQAMKAGHQADVVDAEVVDLRAVAGDR